MVLPASISIAKDLAKPSSLRRQMRVVVLVILG